MTLQQHLQFYFPLLGEFKGAETTLRQPEELKQFASRFSMTQYEHKHVSDALENATRKFIEANNLTENLQDLPRYASVFSGTDNSYEKFLNKELLRQSININLQLPFGLMFEWPTVGDVLEHHSGRKYEVLAVHNTTSTTLRYLPTVSYKQEISGETFCKDIYNFNRTFKQKG